MPSDHEELKIDILELGNKIDRLTEITSETKENVSKVKEAVYNPESGLYSRLKSLEGWKSSSSRVIWLVAAALVALIVKSVWAHVSEPTNSMVIPPEILYKIRKEKKNDNISRIPTSSVKFSIKNK